METKERSIITRHVFIDIINGDNNDFLNLFSLLPVRFFKSSSSSSGAIFLMFFLFFLLLRCDFFNLLPPLVRHHRYPSSSSSSLHGRVCHRRRATWARSRCASASPVARWTTECSPPACALCNEKSSLITRSSRARVVATDRKVFQYTKGKDSTETYLSTRTKNLDSWTTGVNCRWTALKWPEWIKFSLS